MAQKRGYSLQSETPSESSLLSDFRWKWCFKNPDGDELLVVMMESDKPKLTIAAVRKLRQWKEATDSNAGIIAASLQGSTPSARDELVQIEGQEFTYSQLMIDITEHCLYMPHTALQVQEADALLQRLRIKQTDLPKLLCTDAVCRFFNFKSGQIVRIDRTNGLQPRNSYYRVVE